MKSKNQKNNAQYEVVCIKCKSAIILEPDEVDKGEFTCPECSELNKFTRLDLK